jgi:hypothetical protein
MPIPPRHVRAAIVASQAAAKAKAAAARRLSDVSLPLVAAESPHPFSPIKRQKSNEDSTKCDIDPSEYQNDESNLDDPINLLERNVSLCLSSNQVPSLSESCTIEVVSASTTTLASVGDDFLANAAALPESRPVQEIQQSEVFESRHIYSIYEMHQSRSQAQDIQEQQLKQVSGDFEQTKQTLETGCIQ